MKTLFLSVLAGLALSGCAMLSGKPPAATAPTAEVPRPTGPIDLGDYEKESASAAVGVDFQEDLQEASDHSGGIVAILDDTLRIGGGQPSGHSAAATRICLTSGRTSDGMGIP